MFFLQYILPNLISIFSLIISVVLGYFTYKLDKTTKENDNKIKEQSLEIQKFKEESNLNYSKALLLAVETLSKIYKDIDPKEMKKSEKKVENLVKINANQSKKENSWNELKKFLNKKK